MTVFYWAAKRFLQGGLLALVFGVGILICVDGIERSGGLVQGMGEGELALVLLARLPLLGREVIGFFVVVGCVLVAAQMQHRREWLGLSSVGVGPEKIAFAASLTCGGLALGLGLGLELLIPCSQRTLSESLAGHHDAGAWSLVEGTMVSIGEVSGNRLLDTRIVYASEGRLTGLAQDVEASWNGEAWDSLQGRYLEMSPDGSLFSGSVTDVGLPRPEVLSVIQMNRAFSELSMRELSLFGTENARAWLHFRLVVLLAPFFWCWGFSRSLLRPGRETPWRVLGAGVQVGATQLALVLLAAVGAPVLWIWIGFGGLVCVPTTWEFWPIRTGRRGRASPRG